MKHNLFLGVIVICAILLCSCGSGQEASSTEMIEEVLTEETATEIPDFKVVETASEFAGGDGSEEDPYQIATPQQLMLFAECCLDYEKSDCCFVLTEDIVFNDVENIEEVEDLTTLYGWESTGYSFGGSFDGGGHTISGLYIYPDMSAGTHHCGFIGYAINAQICNLTILNSCVDTCEVVSVSAIGTILGTGSNIKIENCSSDAVIYSNSPETGGIAGWMQSGGDLQDCAFYGKIVIDRSYASVGGIVGYAAAIDVFSCSTDFEITEKNCAASVGGIVGTYKPGSDSIISDCVNYSNLTVNLSSLGGLVHTVTIDQDTQLEDEGWVYSTQSLLITGCSNEGDLYTATGVISGSSSGGLIASVHNYYKREVGTGSLVIESCTNDGSVSGVQCVGGIIGQVSSAYALVNINRCVNNGVVAGETYVGGIVGQMDFSCVENSISESENHGEIYASNAAVGGILGSYGILSLYVSEETCAQFTIDGCINYGSVSNGEGILGTGGILGLSSTMTDTMDELLINGCVNYGDVSAESSGQVGGVLGSSESGLMSGGTIAIISCANAGSIILGDGQGVYKSSEEIFAVAEEDGEASAETIADNKTILLVGGSALGGIVGYSRLCEISDCVNIGILYYDSEQSAFGGGICGMYLYVPDSETYSIEKSSITDCISTDEVDAAYSLASDWGEETILNVSLVSTQEAKAAFDALIDR